jgi:cyclopropane-fatty-acyl-phospholipid synthase
VCHWDDFDDGRGFDAVYTDEVIVHFNRLDEFFNKVRRLLRPGGLMVNKDVHYTRHDYLQMSRGEVFINEIYGFTGNYRTLHEELRLVDEAGFELVWHEQIGRDHYQKTLSRWLSNQFASRDRLVELVGKDFYDRFRIYLKLVRQGFNTPAVTIDVVTGRKV